MAHRAAFPIDARHDVGGQVANLFGTALIEQAGWHLRDGRWCHLFDIVRRDFDRRCVGFGIVRVDLDRVSVFDHQTSHCATVGKDDDRGAVLVRDVFARFNDRPQQIGLIKLVRHAGQIGADVATKAVEAVTLRAGQTEVQAAASFEVRASLAVLLEGSIGSVV